VWVPGHRVTARHLALAAAVVSPEPVDVVVAPVVAMQKERYW